jgi:uncharacterized protein
MTRRVLLHASLAGAASTMLRAGQQPKPALECFNYSGVKLFDGMLLRQCGQTRDVFLQLSDEDLLLGFRRRAGLTNAAGKALPGWYGGDVFNAFGQYVSGMARLGRGLRDQGIEEKAYRLMSGWARTIEPDGYFYYSRRPITPHYIYDKMMCGLVDLLEFGGHREAIPWMEKITVWAAANLDRSRKTPLVDGATYDGNGEWYTLGENLYRAYLLTGDQRFKDFGDVWQYPAYWGMFTRAAEPDPLGFHAYSHVNTLSSAAMAYAVSGDERYLGTIIRAFEWLERTQMYATGGFGPDEKMQRPSGSLGESLQSTYNNFETVCGSWAGFKLGRYLLQFTGEAKYGDWIERLLYNGIGAALPLKVDGSNFYYSEYNTAGGRKQYSPNKWTCCSGTLPQAVAEYHNLIYFRDAGGLYVNLYVPSEVSWTAGQSAVRVEQQTAYPESETSAFIVYVQSPLQFRLSFRVPRWSRGFTAEINGEAHKQDATPGRWATIDRRWVDGDRVTIRIAMQPQYVSVDPQHPKRVALQYGPVVLVGEQVFTMPAGGDARMALKKSAKPLEFDIETTQTTRFVPFYKAAAGSMYRMYFDRV